MNYYGYLEKAHKHVCVLLDGSVIDQEGNLLGTCHVPVDELHAVAQPLVWNGDVLLPMCAGRSKKDEIWYRWNCIGQNERPQFLKNRLPQKAKTVKIRGKLEQEPAARFPKGYFTVEIEVIRRAKAT